MQRVDDAEYRTEQPDKGRYIGDRCKQRQPAFETAPLALDLLTEEAFQHLLPVQPKEDGNRLEAVFAAHQAA